MQRGRNCLAINPMLLVQWFPQSFLPWPCFHGFDNTNERFSCPTGHVDIIMLLSQGISFPWYVNRPTHLIRHDLQNPSITLVNTQYLLSGPLEYNNQMLGMLSLLLNFSSIRLIHIKGQLDNHWLLSNDMSLTIRRLSLGFNLCDKIVQVETIINENLCMRTPNSMLNCSLTKR